MSRGIAALSTQQKAPEATPATVTAAGEGLSLSGTTVVLGQTQFDPGNPAEITTIREIPLDSLSVNQPAIVFTELNQTINPGTLQLGIVPNATGNESNGFVFGGNEGNGVYMRFLRFNVCFSNSLASDPVAFPGVAAQGLSMGTDVQLYGDRSVEPGIGSKDLSHSGSTLSRAMTYDFTNTPFTVNLPVGVAGYEYVIACVSNDVTIQPQGGDCIQIGTTVGAANAPANSVVLGSVITLLFIGTPNGGVPTWLATSIVGTWTV